MIAKRFLFCVLFLAGLLAATGLSAKVKEYRVADYGIVANAKTDAVPMLRALLQKVKEECRESDKIVLRFENGRYDFHPEQALEKEYYVSNHDQGQPKKVAIVLEDWNNLTIEGNGAQFVFHGRMMPLALLRSENCVFKDFSIDFENPQIAQIRVLRNDPAEGLTFEVAPWVNYRITADSVFETYGKDWKARQSTGIAFEGDTKHLIYNTGDLFYSTKGVREVGERTLLAPAWKDARLVPGTVIAMRTWYRPVPGIFLYGDKNTTLYNVKVHYAEGMGLLAQLCTDITMDGFGVCLKGKDDPRYFTTQADATHFSQCKGKIDSRNGLYEGMMDDAINVHGIYLKIKERKDDYTFIARYEHGQAWGFEWGDVKNKVQFVRSKTMEVIGEENEIASIRPFDKPSVLGVREFEIRFARPVDPAVNGTEGFGVENLTWTPEVYFAGNTIRNNRARGSLFSTPRRTVVEKNLFDHTSGTAILLCGDCNGWYETGACRDVLIRNNRFINALTSQYQFTNAVISIYPEIPDLKNQQKYFHGGKKGAIRIVDNYFDTFDLPILYAKSVDGLIFKNNTIVTNQEYKPFHWNKKRFWLERVVHEQIEE